MTEHDHGFGATGERATEADRSTQEQGTLPWTPEQVKRVTGAFLARQPLICPICSGPLVTGEAPGPRSGKIEVAFHCQRCRAGIRAPFRRFDPVDFIRPPFETCPKCGQDEFGVLMIHGDNYTRRCRRRECWNTVTYRLPRPKKAVIYLDQHIISDMMKALHPADPARAERAAYARRVFEVLDRAVKLQIVICPDSRIHAKESMVTTDFKALERMYEQLSRKVSFPEVWDIKVAQVVEHARNWHRGAPYKPSELVVQDVIDDDVHGWHDNLMIGVAYAPDPETIALVRARRDRIETTLTPAYHEWAKVGGSFDDFVEDMVRAFPRGILKEFAAHMERLPDLMAGRVVPNPGDPAEPLCMEFLNAIASALHEEGLELRAAMGRALDYFRKADHSGVPFVHIESLVCSALGWQFARGGRKKKLGRGTTNDLSVIMHFLPYCDAMYVDNEMSDIVNDQRVRKGLTWPTRVFSRKTIDVFIAYVEGLVASAPAEQLALVRRVYGENWGQPFTDMYKPRTP